MGRNVRLAAVFLGAAAASIGGVVLAADAGKSLVNMHGSVAYLAFPKGDPHDVAPNASVTLQDDDVAKTGSQSMGAIVLPDSSRVILASDTTIKLDAFNAVDSTAHFVVFEGKMRFRVEHPQGAAANYTFTTPTANIGVRGTEGDISADAMDGVRVNVYHLGDASMPVHVDMIDGQQFDLKAGQKIWMRWKDGKLQGVVAALTQAEIDRFTELGPPDVLDVKPVAPEAPQANPTYRP